MHSLNYLKKAIPLPKQDNEVCEGLSSVETVASTAEKEKESSHSTVVQLKSSGKKCEAGHSATNEKKEIRLKMLLQQCLSATLTVTDPDGNITSKEIDRGMIVYVCFLKECKQELVEQAVKTIFKVRLTESEVGSMVTIQDIEGDIMIVPQATLGGRIKGSSIQYHSNTSKEEALKLYDEFVASVRDTVNKDSKCKVVCGVYGDRQVLKMDTNGPFSHMLEL